MPPLLVPERFMPSLLASPGLNLSDHCYEVVMIAKFDEDLII